LTRLAKAASAVILLSALGAGIYGMGRSLWLDEAWVANSVEEPSLAAMFFRTDWLQVNPPLFLLLVRNTVRVVGLSNSSLRSVPLALGMLGAACMLLAARRVLSPAWAVLACAALALHPTAIEYSHTLKQYSGELAAAAVLLLATILYLRTPARPQFVGLVAATVLTLPLAYPMVFLLPGVALAVYFTGSRGRFLALAGGAGGMALLLYAVFIRPNFSPALHEFFKTVADSGFSVGLAAAGLFCIFAAVRIVVGLRKTKPGWREWTHIVCLLPCVLFALSAALGLYPSSHRTRLFLLPCFVLLLVMTAEELLGHLKFRTDLAVLCLALAIPCVAIEREVAEHRNLPEEDIAGAVRFLQRNVGAADLVLVHPSVREGFLLYARMFDWQTPSIVFTNTGWPCCQRGQDPKPGGSTERAIVEDLDGRVPRGFSGRAWLYYTTRPTQWTYVGMKEQDAWKKYFWERGCLAGPYFAFENQAISPMDCQRLRK
jgi:Dolichyl-phosphate-mannose-protein mannosyltransferase